MKRRDILKAGFSILPATLLACAATGRTGQTADWAELDQVLGDRLKPVDWPLVDCIRDPNSPECRAFFEAARNPFFLGDHAGLTQSFGWTGAWTMKPSDGVVEAQTADDIAFAVRFAGARGLRLAIKGGGHSYKGGSNADNSLLLWTRRMNQIVLHDNFVPTGTTLAPVPAVTVGAGAMWGEVYRAVCVGAGRYVQGGGCLTVGVAGLVQSGGFGSFSKRYGLAAASLLEAEIVTADGKVRVVSAERDSELFFALKGGGGCTFGVVTQLTLMTHDLPRTFGAVFAEIRAVSDQAFRSLIARTIAFYADELFNPHWGEQLRMRPNNTLSISMVFQDVSQQQAEATWASLFDWVRARSDDYRIAGDPAILTVPARSFWDPAFLRKLPGVVLEDTQPGASQDRIFWSGNREEAGQVIHAYQSAWIPATLLEKRQQARLADGLFAASRHWSVSLHTNKGLAGAAADTCAAALETAMNPVVIDAFALLICAADGPPAYPGVAGREPDAPQARRDAERVSKAMAALREHISTTGSYLAESDYFEPDWQSAFWGGNYRRLLSAKRRYDPDHLFGVHHGVGMA